MKSRNFAEWTTFGLACAIVGIVVGLIVVQIPGTDSPPAVSARITGPAEAREGGFVVPVEVRNRGDATAENVQVIAELEIGDNTLQGDQVVDFLSGGESHELEFVFEDDPKEGTLTVRTTGYTTP